MVDQELLQAIGAMMDQKIAPIYTRLDKLEEDILEIKVTQDNVVIPKIQVLETEVLEIKVTQEGVVLPKIELLAEGHENIVEHIQEKIDARADKLQDSIDVLEIAVKYHSKDINELKKAQ